MALFPDDIYPTECYWKLVTVSEVFETPWSKSRQTMTLAQYWQAELTFASLNRDKGARLHGLLTKLRGPAGRIELWDHAFATPRGNGGGYPVVDGAGQSGNVLNIRGATPNVTWLKVGDYFQLGNQLHIMTEDASTDASGRCQLEFEAAMRYSPADGAYLNLNKPTATMMLKDDDQGGRRSSKRLILSSTTVTFVEDVTV